MKDKLVIVWQHFIASYLRALGAALVAFQVGVWADKIDVSVLTQLWLAAVGALFAPVAKALTETADVIDTEADDSTKDAGTP